MQICQMPTETAGLHQDIAQRHLHVGDPQDTVKSIPCPSPVPCFGTSRSQMEQKNVEARFLQAALWPTFK